MAYHERSKKSSHKSKRSRKSGSGTRSSQRTRDLIMFALTGESADFGWRNPRTGRVNRLGRKDAELIKSIRNGKYF